MTIYVNNIPQELKERPHWVVWKKVKRNDGTYTKALYSAITGRLASSTKSSTWTDFETAVVACERNEWDGVGFVFTDTPYIGVDIDHCTDETKVLTSAALDIYAQLNSYTEFSPSGTGIHIICRGKLPDGRRSRKDKDTGQKFEMYGHGSPRYFTFTGNILDPLLPIRDCQKQINVVHTKYISDKSTSKPTGESGWKLSDEPWKPNDDDIQEFNRCLERDNVLRSYWEGFRPHGSESENDLGFMSKLAYHCGGNAAFMEWAFLKSPYYESKDDEHKIKWGRKDYRERTISKALLSFKQTFKPSDFTDTANARIFAREFEGQAIYVSTIDWLIWDGKVWKESELEVAGLAMELTDRMIAEAKDEVAVAYEELGTATTNEDSEAKKKAKERVKAAEAYLRHASNTRSQQKIYAMLKLARTLLEVKPDRLDTHHYILNTPTGVVDLRNGITLPHDPEYLCTKITRYGPGNRGKEIWESFLDTVTQNNAEMKTFLQHVAGMAAVGKVFEENLIMAIGSGGNGKSAHYNTLYAVMGDYAGMIAADVLTTVNRGKGAELATLKGKRLIVAAELEEGARLSASMLKQLTSTDSIRGERKYKDPEQFNPSHTTILYTNYLPRIGSMDHGTWRRILVVPFTAIIPKKAEVKNYADTLANEAGEAVMSWIIEGAVNFCKTGHRLEMPNIVNDAIEEYRNDNDWMSTFLYECCETGIGKTAPSGQLYTTYRNWAGRNGEFIRHNRDFNVELERRGFSSHRGRGGIKWSGISIIPSAYSSDNGDSSYV